MCETVLLMYIHTLRVWIAHRGLEAGSEVLRFGNLAAGLALIAPPGPEQAATRDQQATPGQSNTQLLLMKHEPADELMP